MLGKKIDARKRPRESEKDMYISDWTWIRQWLRWIVWCMLNITTIDKINY